MASTSMGQIGKPQSRAEGSWTLRAFTLPGTLFGRLKDCWSSLGPSSFWPTVLSQEGTAGAAQAWSKLEKGIIRSESEPI